jgi:hypothetical protein
LAAATRIGAFLALIVVLFLAAYAAGAHFGRVTSIHGHSGGSGPTMHMGATQLRASLSAGRR